MPLDVVTNLSSDIVWDYVSIQRHYKFSADYKTSDLERVSYCDTMISFMQNTQKYIIAEAKFLCLSVVDL